MMSATANLLDCYTEQLADLWAANVQTEKVMRDLAERSVNLDAK